MTNNAFSLPSRRPRCRWLRRWRAARPTAAAAVVRERRSPSGGTACGSASAPDAPWQAQLAVLKSRLRESADRGACCAANPLLGIPFASRTTSTSPGEPPRGRCPEYAYVAEHSATVVSACWMRAPCGSQDQPDQFATWLVGTRSPFGAPPSVDDASRHSARFEFRLALPWQVARCLLRWYRYRRLGRVPAGFNALGLSRRRARQHRRRAAGCRRSTASRCSRTARAVRAPGWR